MNRGFCNKCGKLVTAAPANREGQVFLVKDCPVCGATETLISADSGRYWAKHEIDLPAEHGGCALNCPHCQNPKKPNLVFVDVTNRCNLNCPICINNTPSMGFLFEPPLDYFDTIFRHFSTFNPRPAIQLFGGEPTARSDLFEIIRLARSYGLPTRVVTNGIALANEEYCRSLVRSRATILFAYDNDNPALYQNLRGSAKILDVKLKAIDNLSRIPEAKVVFMSLVAKGINDQDLPRLFDFCHERRRFVRGIYFMPLSHTWDPTVFPLASERITGEDIENRVAAAYPDEAVEFFPAGFLGQLKTLLKYLGAKPLPFAGAHPNCESSYLLLSDGEQYLPVNHYVRGTTSALMKSLMTAETRLAAREQALAGSSVGRFLAALRLKKALLRIHGTAALLRIILRHVRLGRLFNGSGPAKAWHALALVCEFAAGRPSRKVLPRHSRVRSTLQLIVLPFEDKFTLETDRLERCPSAFAYVNPADGQVKCVSVCGWSLHKTAVMREIMAARAATAAPPA